MLTGYKVQFYLANVDGDRSRKTFAGKFFLQFEHMCVAVLYILSGIFPFLTRSSFQNARVQGLPTGWLPR